MQSFAQARSFKFATLQWFTPVPGLGPVFCHDRDCAQGLAFPRPWDCVGVTVALGVCESPLLWFRDWHVAVV